MVTKFKFMGDGPLYLITIAKPRTKLERKNIGPVHCVKYKNGLKARAFEKARSIKYDNDVALAFRQREPPDNIFSRKRWVPSIFVSYIELITMSLRESYPTPEMIGCIGYYRCYIGIVLIVRSGYYHFFQ